MLNQGNMEAVIFIGIQATGKSSFYKSHLFNTHVRISRDMLKTNNREKLLIRACLEGLQSYVIDKINHTVKARERYIKDAKDNNFRVTGYYFQSKIYEAINRNNNREGKERVPEAAIKGTYNDLELPQLSEGFDTIYYVRIDDGKFIIEEWDETEY